MRNREAARYARWAAMAAAAIALVVVGTFIERSARQSRVLRTEHAVIPPAVEQQSSSFFLRSGEKGRTIFEVRAARATRFKGSSQRAVLNDVTITMHGYKLDRDDTIEARECSYDPAPGSVRCAGPVRIELRPATDSTGAKVAATNTPAAKPVQIQTSDLAFDSKTGNASTPAAVEFSFPQGSGRGTGIAYSARTATLRVARGVEFDLAPSPRTGGAPVSATGSALEIRRDERTVQLFGPVDVRQGGRELTAENVLVEMDKDFHARHVTAEGHPQIRSTENAKELAFSADRLEALLSGKGWVQSIAGDGNVSGSRRVKDSTEHISAAHLQMAMLPRGNFAQTLTASGNVVASSNQVKGSQALRTEALRLTFTPPAGHSSGLNTESKRAAGLHADGIGASQQIQTAETLGPASIEANGAGEKATRLDANQFVARFDAQGRMRRLLGHGDVEVRQQTGGKQPQTITAPELDATFGSDGQLATLEETGGVRVEQGDQIATSARLGFVQSPAAKSGSAQAAGVVTLDGAPVLTDAESRTTVGGRVTIATGGQKADEFRATGGVISTLLPSAQANGAAKFSLGLGSGAAHVFADTLSGSAATGHLVYQGHARVWQGDAVLDADRIEIWRDEKKMQAMGGVALVFPQAGGPLAGFPGAPGAGRASASKAQAGKSSQASKSSEGSSGTAVWQVRAASLTYAEAEQRIHFDGGVTAKSQENAIESQSLDVFLAPAAAARRQTAQNAASAGARQLSRIVAQGSVVVQQGTRRGSADRAEYTATDGKFVLSGGQPTLADADGNTVTGRSLTFFLTDDTILIDSQEGSRTLTKHRVEK